MDNMSLFKMKITDILLIFVTTYFASVAAKNPGLGMYLSREAVDGLIRDMIAESIGHTNVNLADMKGQHNTILLDFNWQLSNMSITRMRAPLTKTFFEDKFVHITFKGLSMDIVGNWGVSSKKTILGKSISDAGSFTLHFTLDGDSKFTAFTERLVGMALDIRSCNIDVTGMELKIHDQHKYPPAVQNVINSIATQSIKNSFEQKNCLYITQQAPKKQVRGMTDATWAQGILMDISVFTSFSINDTAVYITLPGEVHWNNTKPLGDKNPMDAPPIPDLQFETGQTGQFIMTSYPLSTAIYTGSKKGLLDVEIDPRSLSDADCVFFSTDCLTVCLGNRLPKIHQMYPNKTFVNVTLKSTDDIRVKIGNKSISVTVGHTAYFHVNEKSLFMLSLNVEFSFVPYVKTNAIVARGTLVKDKLSISQVKVLYSRPGIISGNSTDILNLIGDKLADVDLKPRVKGILDKGADFSRILENVYTSQPRSKLQNMELQLQKNVMVFSFDLVVKLF